MRIPLVNSLRRLDRHWLLNHPILWIMHLHWMACLWIIGLILTCLLAQVLPVYLHSVNSLNEYFLAALALTGLAVSPWIYLQARFAPQLRQDYRTRSAVYLLAGYLIILGSHLAWPYAFIHILETRIANRIGEGEVQEDLANLGKISTYLAELETIERIGGTKNQAELIPPPGWQAAIVELYWKYLGLKLLPGDNYSGLSELSILKITIGKIALIKAGEVYYDTNDYHDDDFRFALFSAVILLSLILRAFHMTNTKDLLGALFCAVFVYSFMTILSSVVAVSGTIAFAVFLFVFSVAMCSAFLYPRQEKRSAVLTVGLTIFTLLLAWMPPAFIQLCYELDYLSSHLRAGILLYDLGIGVVMLLIFMPWIQRRYRALYAKPS